MVLGELEFSGEIYALESCSSVVTCLLYLCSSILGEAHFLDTFGMRMRIIYIFGVFFFSVYFGSLWNKK